jgi:hypothetical protein
MSIIVDGGDDEIGYILYPVPLTKYHKTDNYHYINDRKVPAKGLRIHIYHTHIGIYAILLTCFANKPKQLSYHIQHLPVDMVWKILKPCGDECINFYMRYGNEGGYRYQITKSCITSKHKCELVDQLKVKLYLMTHETETAFRQRLLQCSQTDCKIDFL